MFSRYTPLVLSLVLAGAGFVSPVHAADPASAPTSSASTTPPPTPAGGTLVPEPIAAGPERQHDKVIDPAEVAVDGLLVRPLGLAATAVGGAIYLVVLPFAAISGDTKSPARSLVGAPAQFTFKRRLGDFRSVQP